MARRLSLYAGIVLLSAATLMYELVLTRVFALIEWYHLAFLSINVALLGYAAGGTLLSIRRGGAPRRWPTLSLLLPLGLLASYCTLNLIPFDSYQLTWSLRQAIYLVICYVSLVIPFALSGYVLAHWLSVSSESSHLIYAANLVGSSLGCLSLLLSLPALGAEGTVLLSVVTASLGAIALVSSDAPWRSGRLVWAAGSIAVVATLGMAYTPRLLELRLSPYKSLSYAQSASDARPTYQKWNVYSRVDVIESAQIHSAPGLSLNYRGRLPEQVGITIDGDNLSPISRRRSDDDAHFTAYMPSSIAYQLRPGARAMILQPRGGLETAIALDHGATRVVAIEDNELIAEAVQDLYGAYSGALYADPRVELRIENPRRALERSAGGHDIVVFALSESFHPLTSGAYSLAENHLYTTESMVAALNQLGSNGILVVSRWLQDPPSESIRAASTLISALSQVGITRPAEHLLAYRSWSTMVLIASRGPFSAQDVRILRERCDALAYDLVHYISMSEGEANIHNRLSAPLYYRSVRQLLLPDTRSDLIAANLYDISPPTDDRPYFGHYFRWRQIPGILRNLGKSWQPFGGSGFLLVLLLLGLSLLATATLVALPALACRTGLGAGRFGIISYFAAIGLGYLMIEMPLMQQFILYLGQPVLAFIVVLAALLFTSGLGSALSSVVSLRGCLVGIILLAPLYPSIVGQLLKATFQWEPAWRMAVAWLALAPIGTLMGVPFAGGIAALDREELVPWIWAINGGASVISSVLATLLALSFGHRFVLGIAAVCYALALFACKEIDRKTTARESPSVAQRLPP